MIKADQFSGTGLVGKGDKKVPLVAGNNTVKTGGGRLCRILMVSGTGGIDVYDGTSAAGEHDWSITATTNGAIYELDLPVSTGIFIVMGATTAATAIFA